MKSKIISELDLLYMESYDCYGRNVDKAIELIRRYGIIDKIETTSILKLSKYNNENRTSVYGLITN